MKSFLLLAVYYNKDQLGEDFETPDVMNFNLKLKFFSFDEKKLFLK